jgi:hypothetical protein
MLASHNNFNFFSHCGMIKIENIMTSHNIFNFFSHCGMIKIEYVQSLRDPVKTH